MNIFLVITLIFVGVCIGAILTATLLFFTDRIEEIADLNNPDESTNEHGV